MNRKRNWRSTVMILPLALSVLLVNAAAPGTAAERMKRVASWLVYEEENGFDRIERNADILASLSVFGNAPRDFIDRCHRLQIQVYRMVTGDSWAFDTPAHAQAAVQSYLRACSEEGYDGIDLDFENLDAGLQERYSDFLLLVSQSLHRIGKKLSHCVGFYPGMERHPPRKLFYDPWVVAQTCDLVRVMCYDLYWAPGWGDPTMASRPDTQGIGPTSSFPWAKTALAFWLDRVPRRKLIMGLPAYANDYALSPGGKGKQVYAPAPPAPAGTGLRKAWLWYERLYVYVYPDQEGATHVFYASDAESTRAHLETATELKLAGVGFWHFSSVGEETWKAVREWLRTESSR
jgi:spore germination protein YaaH